MASFLIDRVGVVGERHLRQIAEDRVQPFSIRTVQALGGPRDYPGEGRKEHWIGGDGHRQYGPRAIDRGLKLFVVACALNAAAGAGILLFRVSLG